MGLEESVKGAKWLSRPWRSEWKVGQFSVNSVGNRKMRSSQIYPDQVDDELLTAFQAAGNVQAPGNTDVQMIHLL